MNEEYGENEFSYKNIGKRFVRLANRDLIEEIKLETVENLHGRKDYRVTMKGLDHITRYFLTRPNDMQILVEYMNKFGLDKSLFAVVLNQGHALTIEALNVYQGLTGTLFNPTKDIDIESEASLKKATRIQEEYETG